MLTESETKYIVVGIVLFLTVLVGGLLLRDTLESKWAFENGYEAGTLPGEMSWQWVKVKEATQ